MIGAAEAIIFTFLPVRCAFVSVLPYFSPFFVVLKASDILVLLIKLKANMYAQTHL